MADISNKKILTNEPYNDAYGQYNYMGGQNLGKPEQMSLESEDVDLYSRFAGSNNILPSGYMSHYEGSGFIVDQWYVKWNYDRGDTDNQHWRKPKFSVYFYDSAFHETHLTSTNGNTINSWLNTISGQNGHRIGKVSDTWWASQHGAHRSSGTDEPGDLLGSDSPYNDEFDATWDNYTAGGTMNNPGTGTAGVGVYNYPVNPITHNGYDLAGNSPHHFGQNMIDFSNAIISGDPDEYYLFIFVTHANEVEQFVQSFKTDERNAEYSWVKVPKYLLYDLWFKPNEETCGYQQQNPCNRLDVCAYSQDLHNIGGGNDAGATDKFGTGSGGGIFRHFKDSAVILNNIGSNVYRPDADGSQPANYASDLLHFNAEDDYGDSPGHDDWDSWNTRSSVFNTQHVCITFFGPNYSFNESTDTWGTIENPNGWDEEGYESNLWLSGVTAIIDKDDDLYGPYWHALRGSNNPLNFYAEISYSSLFWNNEWHSESIIEDHVNYCLTEGSEDYWDGDAFEECDYQVWTVHDFYWKKGVENSSLLKLNESIVDFRPISTFYTYYENDITNNQDLQSYFSEGDPLSIYASAPNNIRFEVNIIDEPSSTGNIRSIRGKCRRSG
jgi:hypothetical protein